MFSRLIPKRVQRRIASWIVLENLAAIKDESDMRRATLMLQSTCRLSARFHGIVISVGIELIRPVLRSLIARLPYGSRQLSSAVAFNGAVSIGPGSSLILNFLTSSDLQHRWRMIKQIESNIEGREWIIPVLRQALFLETDSRIRYTIFERLVELTRDHRFLVLDFEPALKLAADNDPAIRLKAVEYLKSEPAFRQAAIPALVDLYQQESQFNVRIRMLEIFGLTAAFEDLTVPLLIGAVDLPGDAGLIAIDSLGRLGPKAASAVPRLTLELLRGDERRATFARSAISRIGFEAPGSKAVSAEPMIELLYSSVPSQPSELFITLFKGSDRERRSDGSILNWIGRSFTAKPCAS